jgi:hypothetical protein
MRAIQIRTAFSSLFRLFEINSEPNETDADG